MTTAIEASMGCVTEITAESATSFEVAIRVGIEPPNMTLRYVRSAWINEQQVICGDGQPTKYRGDMKATFVLD